MTFPARKCGWFVQGIWSTSFRPYDYDLQKLIKLTTKDTEIVSPTVQHFGDDLSFEYLDKNNDMLIPSHEINEIESPYLDPIINYEQPYMTYKKKSYQKDGKNTKQKWQNEKFYLNQNIKFPNHVVFNKRKPRDKVKKRQV